MSVLNRCGLPVSVARHHQRLSSLWNSVKVYQTTRRHMPPVRSLHGYPPFIT